MSKAKHDRHAYDLKPYTAAYWARYKEEHAEQIRAKQRERYYANRERIATAMRERERQKRSEDPGYRLSSAMSCGIRRELQPNKPGCGWEKLVGYSLAKLMAHLESQFQPGMTWDNYGKWHVDHIRPKSSFSYGSPYEREFKECWSLTNLRPLWASDNLRRPKGPRSAKKRNPRSGR